MIVTVVHVKVKKEHIDEFIGATIDNHNASVMEKGNLRFDVIQNEADPTRFILYEAYKTEEAAKKHKATSHYLEWRDTVADWMDEPREGIRHNVICLH